MLKEEEVSFLRALGFTCAIVALALIGSTVLIQQADASVLADARSLGFQVFESAPRAHDIVIATTRGKVLRLSDLEGRVILLNFWRKDCPYCEQEKAYLKRLKQSLGTVDLQVLCVNFTDDPSWVTHYAKKSGTDLIFAVLPEGKKRILEGKVRGKVLGYYLTNGAGEAIYEIKGFPSTYVIDKEGRVIATHLGMARWNSAPVQEWISQLAQADTHVQVSPPREYELPAWMDRLLNRPLD